jgi:RNA polymerase sigma factor (TIGR02999 family)
VGVLDSRSHHGNIGAGGHRVGDITELLHAASEGDRAAADRLFALMYENLKRLAHTQLRRSGGHLELNTTLVVHESFLRLVGNGPHTPADRLAFYSYVGKVMRSVVCDTIRETQARKRGGDQIVVTLTTTAGDSPLEDRELVAIDDALSSLEKMAPALKELVELRYFVGLTVAEISELTGKAVRTIEREWEKARLLLRELMREA